MSEQEAEGIRKQMRELRCELNQEVQQIVDSARTMADWHHYVRTYPLICVGLAAAVGFLVVPRRQRMLRPDPEALYKLAKREQLVVQPSPSKKREGFARSLIRMARNAALSGITAYASKQAHSFFDARRSQGDSWSKRDSGAVDAPVTNRELENDF